MEALINWHHENTGHSATGFFQIGGELVEIFSHLRSTAIAQDPSKENVKRWSYFCQIMTVQHLRLVFRSCAQRKITRKSRQRHTKST